MIGNAHIDPVWLWQWPEGYQEVRATFRSALDRMHEYPEFIFTANSAAYYAWVKEIDPAMFEEIRERVAEGRWAIVGGWWVEPDCNIPSGESFVRHALYSQRWFQAELGRHGHGRLQRRPVRAQRDAAPAPAPRRHGLVRVHAPWPAREAAAEPGLLVGVAGRLAGARRCACRTSTARRARTWATTSTSRSPSCRTGSPR